jgi:hypothetical protein
MAASFEIRSYTHERVTIRVNGVSDGDEIRVLIFEVDAANPTVNELYYADGTSETLRIGDLEPETDYFVDVRINNDNFLGAQYFTTDAAPKIVTIYFDDDGDDRPESSVEVETGDYPPDIDPPKKSGYVFKGYWTSQQDEADGTEVQYYDEEGISLIRYNDKWSSITLYAYWQKAGTVFAWATEKVQGEEFKLTADEWNALASFVNSKRSRAYSFTVAVKGNDFTAAMYNEVVEAIGEGTEVEKGDIITADLLNELVANANNM